MTLARSFFFRLMDVRDDFLRRLNHAAAQARERQRRAHQFQKRSSFDRVIPLFGLLGKFATHKFFEDGRIGELFQIAPILCAESRLSARQECGRAAA